MDDGLTSAGDRLSSIVASCLINSRACNRLRRNPILNGKIPNENERNRLRERRILRPGGCEDFDSRPRPAFRRRGVRGAARQQRPPLPRRRSLRADVGRPEGARDSGPVLREPVRDDPDRAGAAQRRAVGSGVHPGHARRGDARARAAEGHRAERLRVHPDQRSARRGRANIRAAWPWRPWRTCAGSGATSRPRCCWRTRWRSGRRRTRARSRRSWSGRTAPCAKARSSNFFAVIGGSLRTHPADNHVLPGVTRNVVLELARERTAFPPPSAPSARRNSSRRKRRSSPAPRRTCAPSSAWTASPSPPAASARSRRGSASCWRKLHGTRDDGRWPIDDRRAPLRARNALVIILHRTGLRARVAQW